MYFVGVQNKHGTRFKSVCAFQSNHIVVLSEGYNLGNVVVEKGAEPPAPVTVGEKVVYRPEKKNATTAQQQNKDTPRTKTVKEVSNRASHKVIESKAF